jgi:hypothetical protein
MMNLHFKNYTLTTTRYIKVRFQMKADVASETGVVQNFLREI